MADFLNELNWPIQWEKEGGVLLLDLAFITCLFLMFVSWVLFPNDCLERGSTHITAKLDEHITFGLFWEVFFNVFELTVFIWHFCDTCILHVFVIYKKVFIVKVTESLFWCKNEGSQWGDCYMDKKVLIFFKNMKLF